MQPIHFEIGHRIQLFFDKLFIKEVARNIEVQSPVWETRGIVNRQSGKSFVIAVIQQLQKCLEPVEYPSLGTCRQANTFFIDFDPIGFISCHDGTIAEVQFYSVISGSRFGKGNGTERCPFEIVGQSLTTFCGEVCIELGLG